MYTYNKIVSQSNQLKIYVWFYSNTTQFFEAPKNQETKKENVLGDRILIEFQVLSSNPLQSLPFHQNATGMHNIMHRMTKQ